MGSAIFIEPYDDSDDGIKLAHNLLDVIDMNIIAPIRLACRDITEKTGRSCDDALSTIRSALNVFEVITNEVEELEESWTQ